MTKTSRQKFKYLEKEKSFSGKLKRSFMIFKGLLLKLKKKKILLGGEISTLKAILKYF